MYKSRIIGMGFSVPDNIIKNDKSQKDFEEKIKSIIKKINLNSNILITCLLKNLYKKDCQ